MLHFLKTGNCMPEMRHIFAFNNANHGSAKTTGHYLIAQIRERLSICIEAYCDGGPAEKARLRHEKILKSDK